MSGKNFYVSYRFLKVQSALVPKDAGSVDMGWGGTDHTIHFM